MDEVYKELETPEGERKIYRIAKARDKSAKDFTQIRQIKDEQGVVLWELTYPTLAGRHRRMHAKTRTCGIQVPGNTGDPGSWGRSLASL